MRNHRRPKCDTCAVEPRTQRAAPTATATCGALLGFSGRKFWIFGVSSGMFSEDFKGLRRSTGHFSWVQGDLGRPKKLRSETLVSYSNGFLLKKWGVAIRAVGPRIHRVGCVVSQSTNNRLPIGHPRRSLAPHIKTFQKRLRKLLWHTLIRVLRVTMIIKPEVARTLNNSLNLLSHWRE